VVLIAHETRSEGDPFCSTKQPMNQAITASGGRRLVRNKACVLQRRADDRKNGLLACLPDEDFDMLKSYLEVVELPKGTVLCGYGVRPTHAYFPVTAVVSLVYVANTGATLELANVGCDGMVGIGVFMGGEATSSSAVVQRGGTLFRLPARELQVAFVRRSALQHLFLRYTQSLLHQMTQTAACTRHHSVYQQLCRWLLSNDDLSPGSDILQSHEAIAHALGVRREGITAEAGRLRSQHVICYDRGRITVLDRTKLEEGACECYGRVRKETARLLPREVAT
jgi:CRP-like cAMP-binding protein